jgi:hypothetical protein
VAGLFFKKLGHFRIQLVLATISLTAFCGMMASTTQHTEIRAIVVSTSTKITITSRFCILIHSRARYLLAYSWAGLNF